MKQLLFICVLIINCCSLKAQSKSAQIDTTHMEVNHPYNDDDYTRPTFPGGLKQFYKYLAKSIHYPTSAVKGKIHGKVYLNFTIEKDGNVDSVKVIRGVSKDIDMEAIRVLKSSPKWNPGTHHRNPIPYRYSIPINFELPKKGKQKSHDQN
ncbi:energy transducer TonB [Mucilaginibacter ginsenosidivorans]|uniref:Energy transducer TonB n=1 Tax=Mucilaginibacter ginsenosidivorans TaxID=398053 RepID=A0A5B8UZB0_9SPHI|nr:energy transducer TonB [Mucilaginibacter ginsenosidivorans]QEC64454.1 energy transducer TonB [Mucilaginibacter ginsenosidivorans]